MTGVTATATGGESAIVQRAREVARLAREARGEIDALGRLPERVLEAIHEAGLFRMAVPASVGGGEVHPLEYSRWWRRSRGRTAVRRGA
jgi:alkylation response protein AidB-like acyl-CoA dehydrogenase